MGNQGSVTAAAKPWHNQPCSADFILPPLSILAFRPERVADKGVASPQAEAEETPAMLQGAKQSSSAVDVRASHPPHPNPAPEPGKDAFHRVPDSALKALDAVERVLTGSGSAMDEVPSGVLSLRERGQLRPALDKPIVLRPECARPRAQQVPTRTARWKVPIPNCLRTSLRPGTGAPRRGLEIQLCAFGFGGIITGHSLWQTYIMR